MSHLEHLIIHLQEINLSSKVIIWEKDSWTLTRLLVEWMIWIHVRYTNSILHLLVCTLYCNIQEPTRNTKDSVHNFFSSHFSLVHPAWQETRSWLVVVLLHAKWKIHGNEFHLWVKNQIGTKVSVADIFIANGGRNLEWDAKLME